jgi:hypothetical protein
LPTSNRFAVLADLNDSIQEEGTKESRKILIMGNSHIRNIKTRYFINDCLVNKIMAFVTFLKCSVECDILKVFSFRVLMASVTLLFDALISSTFLDKEWITLVSDDWDRCVQETFDKPSLDTTQKECDHPKTLEIVNIIEQSIVTALTTMLCIVSLHCLFHFLTLGF